MVEDKAHQLMRDLLPLIDERWVDGAKIRAIVDRLQLRTDEARIYFLRELLALVRRFPLKIYRDEEARQRLMAAVQQALDAAIDEEDA
jgi:type III secretion protein W